MTDVKLPEEVTKHSFRRKVWDYMMKNELVNFPLSVYNRIPNFKGAAEAALRLTELDEFKKSTTIKINPDKPQEPVRYLALEAYKGILVPIPRLRSGLFLHAVPVGLATKGEMRRLASIQGLEEMGKPVGVDSNIKVDLVVLGSVCVSRDGHRLGKGEGFADLEFAMLMRMGAVTQDTTVITTVHDCQIVDNLPAQLFKEYDVPVDIIVTPTQTIFVEPRLKKPTGIIWEMLSQRRLRSMPILQQLREMDEKDGKVVTLKEVDSDTETHQYNRNRAKHTRNKKVSSPTKESASAKSPKEKEIKENEAKLRLPRRRFHAKSKISSEDGVPSDETQMKTESDGKSTPQRRKNYKSKAKSHIEFSLKLSKIPSDVRVRDLKTALSARGVKPSEISWQGYRGVCYLHFSKLRNENSSPDQPIQVDSIVSSLQQLCIGESTDNENNYIVVEPAKPISRIEVTDVTVV